MGENKKFFDAALVQDKPNKSIDPEGNSFDFSASKHAYPPKRIKSSDTSGYSWQAVSTDGEVSVEEEAAERQLGKKFFKIPDAIKTDSGLEFAGKDLHDGKYEKANLENANFSAANLSQSNFSGAMLKGADLSGADLTEADFTGADLTGAVLSGSNLLRTNFTGAKMKGVILAEANLEDAILLNVEMDSLAIDELQAVIEYMAIYYPHKLNLTKLNLTFLDLSKIDLTKVSLRGVDFTGCSLKGVKLWDLDLSECVISPEQIAEALGRVPTPEEMARLLAPKRPKKKEGKGIDMSDLFFDNGKEFGVWDVSREKGLDIGKLVESGMKLFRKSAVKPPIKDEEIIAHIKEEKMRNNDDKSHNEELKERIRQRKEEELKKRAALKNEFQNEVSKDEPVKTAPPSEKKHEIDPALRERVITMDRGRD